MVQDSKCGVLIIEMPVALVVHAKIFISEIVENEQPEQYISSHPRLKMKESFTAILTSIPTHFLVLYERCRRVLRV
jgi:hypothetical protein